MTNLWIDRRPSHANGHTTLMRMVAMTPVPSQVVRFSIPAHIQMPVICSMSDITDLDLPHNSGLNESANMQIVTAIVVDRDRPAAMDHGVGFLTAVPHVTPPRNHAALSCLVLCCLVLSCLVCLVLSCVAMHFISFACFVLFCLVLSSLVLSCLVFSCLLLSCLVLCYLVLSWVVLYCPVFFCLVVHCFVLCRAYLFRVVLSLSYLNLYFHSHILFLSCLCRQQR